MFSKNIKEIKIALGNRREDIISFVVGMPLSEKGEFVKSVKVCRNGVIKVYISNNDVYEYYNYNKYIIVC